MADVGGRGQCRMGCGPPAGRQWQRELGQVLSCSLTKVGSRVVRCVRLGQEHERLIES